MHILIKIDSRRFYSIIMSKLSSLVYYCIYIAA
jgi:hypothetical protein